MFVSRPARRRGGYAVAAEVQILQSKVLPSAVPIETEEAADESTDDYMSEYTDDYMYESADDYMYEPADDYASEPTENTPVDDGGDSTVSGGAGDGEGEGESPDAWFNDVQANTSGGSVSVAGTISSLSGDFSNLTLSFEGAFAGATATIASDGSFSVSVPSGSTGNVGIVNLLQTENGVTTQIDQHSMYA